MQRQISMRKTVLLLVLTFFTILSLSEKAYCLTDEELLEKFSDMERRIQEQQKQLKQQQEQIRQQQQTIQVLKQHFSGKSSGSANKVPSAVDENQVKTIVSKILAEDPRLKESPLDLRAYWKNGLRFENRSGEFKLKIGGRIMNDWAWMRQDSDMKRQVGDLKDGTEFRRVRFYMSGVIYGNIDYKLQFDFADGSSKLKDAYIGIRDLPVGYLKMGHFKEPFSLEGQDSSKYFTFLERALPVAFWPGRNTGIMLSSTAFRKRMTWAVGVFRNTDSHGRGTSEGGHNVTGRITALPWYEGKGTKLLHLGAAYSLRDPRDTVRYRSKPEAHLAPNFVDTGDIVVDRVGLLGLEAAMIYGPVSVQAEYMRADVEGTDGYPDPTYDGFYIQSSYFLTGEHRKYSTSKGTFSRVSPIKNYNFKTSDWGAWEIACRYSRLDLNDSRIRAGKLSDVTVGLNWYLNPNVRMMWNLIRADLDGAGDSSIGLMRVQVDF